MSVEVHEIPLELEYGKKTGILPRDVTGLREWLKTQPHLPGDHITDLDLILVYHCCGRSVAVTKELLDLHFTCRTLFKPFFKDRYYDDKTQFVMENVLLVTPLPTRSPDGYAVFYTRWFEPMNPKDFVVADCFRAGIMRLDLWQYEEGTWPGMLFLVDLDGMTLGHLARLDLQSIQQFLYYLQEAMLVNLKGLHYLNAPPFMDRVMMLLRPFLNKTLMSMLYIHQTGSRTLDKFFPIEDLPKGARGGKGRSIEELKQDNLAKMAAGREFFVQEMKKRVDESKRPGKPKTITDIFGGVEGSFKKLEID